MTAKKRVSKVVQSRIFQRGMQIAGVLFILLTYLIAISPQSFIKLGYFGLFLFNIIGSGWIIIPFIEQKLNIPGIVLASALGNAVNTSINYLVGNSSKSMFSKNDVISKFKEWLRKFGLLMVFIFAIIPFPLDINGLLSGYLGIPYKKYLLVNFLGKVTIFLLVALGGLTIIKFLK